MKSRPNPVPRICTQCQALSSSCALAFTFKGAGPNLDFIHTVHVDRGWIDEQFLSLDHAWEMRRFFGYGPKKAKKCQKSPTLPNFPEIMAEPI